MRSIQQSDIDRRDFGASDAPPPGVVGTCDQNRDNMSHDSEGKKGVQLPSAGPAVEPVPVAVSATLAPGAAGGDSPGVAGAEPSPRGIDEESQIWQLEPNCLRCPFPFRKKHS